MGASQAIRDVDLRAMLRLAGEAGELPADSDARRRHLLEGTCRLVGGQVGMVFVLDRAPTVGPLAEDGPPVTVTGLGAPQEAVLREFLLNDPTPRDPAATVAASVAGTYVTVRRQHVIDEKTYRSSPHFEQFRRPVGIDAQLYSRFPLADGRLLAVGICRPMGDRPFDDRDCRILDLFHEDAGRLYGSMAPPPPSPPPASPPAVAAVTVAAVPAAAADPRVEALPPRLKPVLQNLLAGDAEKQVAMKLGLSRHTVHEYTKVLYRKLGVSSRGELLARFIGRQARFAVI